MSEQENTSIENIDNVEDLPPIETPNETPIKIKKPVSPEKLEQLKQARLKGAEKKKEMKELKSKAKQLPIEEMKKSAMKYDQLQKQKEEIIKPIEKEIKPIEKESKRPTDAYTASGGCPIEKEIITKDKKKRIIKKIIYEDGSEDEIEDMRHMHQQEQNNKYMTMFNNDSYTNLVYQSACDKLKEKVQDERTKYLIKSLMPNYG
jgi:hypothetical protein